MADHAQTSIAAELDKYIREIFVTRLSETPPEYPLYTREKPWPMTENGIFDPFDRGYQRGTIGPAVELKESQDYPSQKITPGRTKDIYTIRFGTSLSFTYKKYMMGGARRLNSTYEVQNLLSDATRITMEQFHAAMLVDIANTGLAATDERLGFDGLPGVHIAHTLSGVAGTTVSNYYDDGATPALPSYTVLQELVTMAADMVDENGYPYPVYNIDQLWVCTADEFPALEAIKSIGRPDTAQRADNVLASRSTSRLTPSSVVTIKWAPMDPWLAVDSTRVELGRYMLEAPDVKGPMFKDNDDMWWKLNFWIARALWEWRGMWGVPKVV